MTFRNFGKLNAIFMKKTAIIMGCAASMMMLAYCTPKASKAISSLPVETKEQITAQYTANELETGKTIFLANCAKCHKLKQPETRTPGQWNKILKRMIPKSKLNDSEGKLVRAYVIANSKEP